MRITLVMVVWLTLLAGGFTQGSSDHYIASLQMPCYPPLARQARVQGQTKVRIELGSDGTVTVADALEGNPILKAASLANVRTWTFGAAQGADMSQFKATVVFEYKLDGEPGFERCATRVAFDSYNKVEITSHPPVLVTNDMPGQFPSKK